MTLIQLADRIPTDADAYRELETMRWGDRPTCCHCHSENVAFLTPANGVSRCTSSGSMSQRRVWQCRDCRRQFSATTGTVMHGSKVSLRVWLLVIFEMCSSKNGVAAREIERKYGVCPRTAWHLMHRIREAMKGDSLDLLGGGGNVVVADETYYGGREANKHASKRLVRPTTEPTRVVPGTPRPSPQAGKTIVLSLIDKRTGQARSRVIPDVTGATLRKAIAEQVNVADSVLYTDELRAYGTFGSEFVAHETVNHAQDQYARYEGGTVITTNSAENFFSQLKRSLDGTHHHVSRKHLSRYLAEFDYRYTTREISDTERMARLVGKVGGKRLTYKRIAA